LGNRYLADFGSLRASRVAITAQRNGSRHHTITGDPFAFFTVANGSLRNSATRSNFTGV
jgi:hypothetical protein